MHNRHTACSNSAGHQQDDVTRCVQMPEGGRWFSPGQGLRAAALQVGAGFWLTDEALLRSKAEQLAKDQFAARRDPADAALQYMALGRRSLLQASFRSKV